ncbi:MAG: HAMP domain-containing histidine kinase [Maricaulaceae bacterium]|nr:HAMP domain-containing histidine kinase [Maricaulaceae bacterium]
MKAPASALKLAALFALVFALAAAALAALLYQQARQAVFDQLRGEIAADRASLDQDFADWGVIGISQSISFRIARDRGGAGCPPAVGLFGGECAARPVYLLQDQNGQALAGNLLPWPEEAPGEGGWVRFSRTGDDGRRVQFLAKVEYVDGRFPLLVGRQVEIHESIAMRFALLAALMAGIPAALMMGLGFWIGRRTARRVEAVNQVFDRVAAGDLKARAGVNGDDEIALLAARANRSFDHVAALVDGMKHLTDRVSHELRRPLARLQAALDDAAEERDPQARAQGIEEARQRAAGLLSTFEALLDVAEIEAGAAGGDAQTDLSAAAAQAVTLYEDVAAEKGVRLSAGLAPAPVLGDAALLTQLAANLVDNAVKFTPAGGTVTVSVQGGPRPVLTVADDGPGVPEDKLGAIFNRFERGAAGQAGGHGLGLALVRAIAIRHGAALKVENAHPGLKVTVRFG